MSKRQFELTPNDLLDAAELLLRKQGKLSESEKLDTVEFSYDSDNNVTSIIVKE